MRSLEKKPVARGDKWFLLSDLGAGGAQPFCSFQVSCKTWPAAGIIRDLKPVSQTKKILLLHPTKSSPPNSYGISHLNSSVT